MKTRNHKPQQGFTFIEVMIAVLVLGVGILAVSKLQGNLMRSGGEANARSVAANLAQKKIDDLRRFIHLTTADATVPDTWSATIVSPNSVAYKHIADNAGGLIASGAQTVGNINYTLAWSAQDYYFVGNNTTATTTPSGAAYPSYKTAHVVVSWDTVSSTNNVVSFDTVINAYSPVLTALASNPSTGGQSPVVPYDPQQQPDVVPITIGDDGVQKETSKPEPDLSRKGDSTQVKFETVTYTQSLDTVKREEFQTFVCNCENGTNNTSQVYGLTTWDDILERIVDVTTVRSKTIAKTVVDNSGGEDQATDCFICCRDGDDVVLSGSNTFKVCRMKRVDGILRMFDPWKMIAFNVIPASYFNDSGGLSTMTTTLQAENIAQYSSYVTNLVRNVLQVNSTEPDYNSYTTVDTAFINNTSTYTNIDGATTIDHLRFVDDVDVRDLQARVVYLDYPPTGVYTTQVINGTTVTYSATNVPLDRIPFYEVNLTKLAGWAPDQDDDTLAADYTTQHDGISNSPSCSSGSTNNRNYATNDEIKNNCETLYSRGEFNAQVVGTSTVTSRIFTSSDGVIDRNINTSTNQTVDSAVGLTIVP